MGFQIICENCKKESILTDKKVLQYPTNVENVEVDIDVEGDVCCGMYITLNLKCINCNTEITIQS